MKSYFYFVFNHSVLLSPNLYSIKFYNSLRTCSILVLVLSTAEPSWTLLSSRQSQRYITTDGQSASKSWCRAPSGAHDQIFITVWQLRSCFMWGALSDERMGLSFVYATGPCQTFSGPSPLVLATIFYCLRFDTSLFFASYDSQGHNGGIRPRLYTGGGISSP
jgi:hypothetical protein